MYWTRGSAPVGEICRSDLDGSNLQCCVTTGSGNVSGIAVDVARGKVYWTEGQEIYRANLTCFDYHYRELTSRSGVI